jgi:hypothetical protein
VHVESALLRNGQLVGLDFPYGSEAMDVNGAEWTSTFEAAHSISLESLDTTTCSAVLRRKMDGTEYQVHVRIDAGANGCITPVLRKHQYSFQLLQPPNLSVLSATVSFHSLKQRWRSLRPGCGRIW